MTGKIIIAPLVFACVPTRMPAPWTVCVVFQSGCMENIEISESRGGKCTHLSLVYRGPLPFPSHYCHPPHSPTSPPPHLQAMAQLCSPRSLLPPGHCTHSLLGIPSLPGPSSETPLGSLLGKLALGSPVSRCKVLRDPGALGALGVHLWKQGDAGAAATRQGRRAEGWTAC